MRIESELFGTIEVNYCCTNPARCMCQDNERILRAYAFGHMQSVPMPDVARTWACIEADRCGEGMYKAEELKNWSDQDLARAVLDAWRMYAESNCGY